MTICRHSAHHGCSVHKGMVTAMTFLPLQLNTYIKIQQNTYVPMTKCSKINCTSQPVKNSSCAASGLYWIILRPVSFACCNNNVLS